MKISEIRAKFPQYNDIPDEQLVIGLHRKFYADMPFAEFHKAVQYDNAPNPTEGMGGLQKFNAGMGKAFSDIGSGAKQLVGMGPNAEEVQETRRLDSSLMKTGAGVAGNVAGNIAALAPLAVVPGANTVAGAGTLGALAGALQPTTGAGERLTNMGTGGALGAGTQALAGPVARRVGEWGADREMRAAALKSQNAVRDQTLRDAQAAGATVPPSAVNPSLVNKILESIAGKAAVGQQAAVNNQPVWDALARKAAHLRPEEAITKDALRRERFISAEPYRQIAAINPQAKAELEALQAARLESKLQWKAHGRSGDVNAYKAATAADAQVAQLQNSLEQHAVQAGKPDLVDAMKKARVDLAQNHQVQSALNVGTGSVEAGAFGRAMDRGAPLQGDLATIGRFQQAFPAYAREGSSIQSPGVSKLAAVLSGGAGMGGFAAGGPAGAAAAAVPFVAPPAARSLQLYRGQTVAPNYSAGPVAQGAAALQDPETQRRAAMLARALALPAVPELAQ